MALNILHISLSSSFTEGWSYHENTLPHWHQKLGNNVTLFARNTKHVENAIVNCECENRIMENGVKLIRLPIRTRKINSWSSYPKSKLIKLIKDEKPNLIWVHGALNFFVDVAVSYKKRIDPSVTIFVDNHNDPSNYGTDILRRLNLLFFKLKTKRLIPYIDHFYGVTPGRCAFLIQKLGIKPEMVSLSMQGGNPDEIDFEHRMEIKKKFREKYEIPLDSFVCVFGGKLTKEKKTLPLLREFSKTNNDNLYLIVFGSFCNEEKEEALSYIEKCHRIKYVGWLNSVETSNIFLSSDLAIFPGRHSVLWEKALSCCLPCAFEQKDGYEHVYLAGAIRLNDISNNPLNIDLNNVSKSLVYLDIKKKLCSFYKEYLYNTIAENTINDYYALKK